MWKRSLLLLALAAPVMADPVPLNERVLVVYNAYSKDSLAVARYYMLARRIPAANKCALKPVEFKAAASFPVEYVAYGDFTDMFAKPIRKCLNKVGKEKILYIVLTYDTPFELSGAPEGAGMAIDSYLADVWDETARSPEPNPYFAPLFNQRELYPPFVPLAEYRGQTGAKLIYSVWRLDAHTPQLAKGMVDKAIDAEQKGLSGTACFDRRGGGENMRLVQDSGYGAGDWDLFRAAQFARQAGFHVVEDTNEAEFGTPPAPARCDDAALYSGWYSMGHYNDVFTWRPGAVGFHLDSGSATNPRSGKSWSANAIHRGITVTSGSVTEPYLTGLPHPAGIFRNLFEGANVGDAFLRNTAMIKWQIINLGDPLYTPFPGGRGPFAKENSRNEGKAPSARPRQH
ncbi:MAG: TIGR03790 family protein [Acidobacteriia bacterium]|nr:TIGR03790 family protein [Terriglobia bacterium]